MADQDLDRPLKAHEDATAKGRRKPRFDVVLVASSFVTAAIGLAGVWALLVNDPLGGEPVATAMIERRAPPKPAGENAAPGAAPAAAAGDHAGQAPEGHAEVARNGVPVVRPGDPMPKSGPVIIQVPGAESEPAARSAGGPAAPPGAVQTAMLEESGQGALPRVAADGRRPMDVYARAQPGVQGPRVALVVTGLGVGREATIEAVKALPGEVTLAFSPYGADVAELVASARKDGHEILLQAPMEPFAFPSNDPGPQTLLTSLPAAANLERLRWTLGRATGYVGIAPLSGARFLQSDEALGPVFTELARRGLMFVAQGQAESRFAVLAEQSGLPSARAFAPIDVMPEADAIDAALKDLEREAKASGGAIGLAGATPLTLKRVEVWRAGLAQRGVTLVPLTAVLKPQGPS